MITRLFPKDVLYILAAMWAVFVLDILLVGVDLDQLGIKPRSFDGLLGIPFSPVLHANIAHIVSNSLALLGTGVLVRMAIGSRRLRWVIIMAIVGSGVGTWLFAQAGLVVGASGLVYGLLGFLFGHAFFHPSLKSWAVAFVSLILFGGAVIAIFSFNPYISWSAHFWGFASGIGASYVLKKFFKQRDQYAGQSL